MRVLVVHNSYREPGGEDTAVSAEADLLASGGHQVELYRVTNPSGPVPSAVSMALSTWNRRQAVRVSTVADRFRPDVVHVHNTWFALSPALLWFLRSRPAARVATIHNYRLLCVNASLLRDGTRCTTCVGRSPWPGVLHRCYRGSAGYSAAAATAIATHRALGTWSTQLERIIVPTELTRRLIADGGVPPGRVVVKPHFTPDPGRRPAPPSASRTVVYAGRLTADKGLQHLVTAWISDPPPGLELVLVGQGPLEVELSAVGRGVRVEPWVPRSRLIAMMLGARAVVAPAPMFETFGLTAVEALASGAPVIPVAGGAAEEVAGPEQPPPVDVSDPVAGWTRAFAGLRNDTSVDAWGRAARRRFEDRFTPQVSLQALLGVYRQAIAARSNP